MKLRKITSGLIAMLLVTAALASSCGGDGDDEDTMKLTFAFNGLEDLGDDYVYEGWLIVDGMPVSAGRFSVDGNGQASLTEFEFPAATAMGASKYVLTIEPASGDDPAPSDTHLLAGDFTGGNASLGVADPAALGSGFSTATGPFILNTPSTAGTDADFSQGIWWLDPAGGPDATLSLPQLPAGWTYEGWVVVDGMPVTTGKFTDPAAADDDGAGPTAGPDGFPPFPGQDYIDPALDLHGGTAVISIEPQPDNSAAPFTLKPLVGAIPQDLAIGTLSPMDNNAAATNPTGSASLSVN